METKGTVDHNYDLKCDKRCTFRKGNYCNYFMEELDVDIVIICEAYEKAEES